MVISEYGSVKMLTSVDGRWRQQVVIYEHHRHCGCAGVWGAGLVLSNMTVFDSFQTLSGWLLYGVCVRI